MHALQWCKAPYCISEHDCSLKKKFYENINVFIDTPSMVHKAMEIKTPLSSGYVRVLYFKDQILTLGDFPGSVPDSRLLSYAKFFNNEGRTYYSDKRHGIGGCSV